MYIPTVTTGHASRSSSVKGTELSPRQDWTSDEYMALSFKARWAELKAHLEATSVAAIANMSRDDLVKLRQKVNSVKVTELVQKDGDYRRLNLWEPIAKASLRRLGSLDMADRGGPVSYTQQFTRVKVVSPPAHAPLNSAAYRLSRNPLMKFMQKRCA